MRNFAHNNNLQIKKPSKLTPLKVNLGLLSAVLVLGVLYIFSANSMATADFQIKKLSTQLSELEAEHKNLELKNSTLQSVSTIQEQTASLNFVPTTSVTYIKDDNFALK